MATARAAERISIESKVRCRGADGEPWLVLQWRRQIDESLPGAAPRWIATGPAVFTLLDASAVIQISGSSLLIVATGQELQVVAPSGGDEAQAHPALPMAAWINQEPGNHATVMLC